MFVIKLYMFLINKSWYSITARYHYCGNIWNHEESVPTRWPPQPSLVLSARGMKGGGSKHVILWKTESCNPHFLLVHSNYLTLYSPGLFGPFLHEFNTFNSLLWCAKITLGTYMTLYPWNILESKCRKKWKFWLPW